MPANYTMETLPKPNNAAVKLEEIPGKRYAVIRFSGMSGEKSLRKNTEELTSFISGKNLNAISAPTYAFYNPPWVLPGFGVASFPARTYLSRNGVVASISDAVPKDLNIVITGHRDCRWRLPSRSLGHCHRTRCRARANPDLDAIRRDHFHLRARCWRGCGVSQADVPLSQSTVSIRRRSNQHPRSARQGFSVSKRLSCVAG